MSEGFDLGDFNYLMQFRRSSQVLGHGPIILRALQRRAKTLRVLPS